MSVPELFAPWFDSLAPGLGDQAQAATQRILYRSAADRTAGRASPGDAMDVEHAVSSARSAPGRRSAGKEEMALERLDRPARRQREPEARSPEESS